MEKPPLCPKSCPFFARCAVLPTSFADVLYTMSLYYLIKSIHSKVLHALPSVVMVSSKAGLYAVCSIFYSKFKLLVPQS